MLLETVVGALFRFRSIFPLEFLGFQPEGQKERMGGIQRMNGIVGSGLAAAGCGSLPTVQSESRV
jgi:hypothetical protein